MTITDRPMTVHRDDAAIDALLPRGIEDDPLLLQRASDPLVRLAADVAERRLDAESPAMGSYHGWLVEEAERQSRAGDELTEAHAAALLDRVRPALQAGRLGIRLESGRPLERSTARTEAGSMSDRDARDAPWFDLQVAAGAGRELWDHPAERWIEVPDLCPPGQYVALSVSGDSMQPLFHPGDILLVRRGPESVRECADPETCAHSRVDGRRGRLDHSGARARPG